MSHVNLTRARQLVRASSLAYETRREVITTSPLLAGIAIEDLPSIQSVTCGIDSVLVARTTFGAVVSFRGTQPPVFETLEQARPILQDWLNDGQVQQIEVSYSPGQVHGGFARSLENLWQAGNLLTVIQKAIADGRRLFLTGHSKGGSLAVLATKRLQAVGITPAGVMTFGAPRVGDEQFADRFDQDFKSLWRFEHQHDLVPHLPLSPVLLQALRSIPQLARVLPDLPQMNLHYQAVGQLCYLNEDNQLVEGDSFARRSLREALLLVRGKDLILDHYLDRTHLPPNRLGYLETIDQL